MLSRKSHAPGRNPGLKSTRDGHHLKKVLVEKYLKIKNKPDLEYFKLRIYSMTLSAGLPNLMRPSL
jgi:hypothetical protein